MSLTPIQIGYIGMGALIFLIFIRMPIGMAMLLVGAGGFAAINGVEPAVALLQNVPYETFIQYSYCVVPLFILMGNFAFKSGLSSDLYWAVRKMMGSLRGGLAMATVGACGAFAAICGSSVATAITMGVVALPEMKKYKYSDALATGAIAAGGTLGILIPPSTIMVIYGIITQQSIGALFMAGFIPGILQMLLYIATIGLLVRRTPSLGPAGESCSMMEKARALSKVWGVVLLFVLVIGGLYAGIFSPNEAAGIGAMAAMLLGFIYTKMPKRQFVAACMDAAVKSTGIGFLIMVGAMMFGYFLAVSRVPFVMADSIAALNAPALIVIIGILLILIALGCFMDSMAIVLLTVPIFFPLVQQMNIDPIWFGILVVRVTEMGLITPPVGLNLFVIKGVANVPMSAVFRGAVPFIAADFIHLTLLICFPPITLFLPSLLM